MTTVYQSEVVISGDRGAIFAKLMASDAETINTLLRDRRLVFTKVADALEVGLDEAFEATNSIDVPWYKTGRVIPLFAGEGCRSTSVGDCIEKDGVFYAVTVMGFDKMDNLA